MAPVLRDRLKERFTDMQARVTTRAAALEKKAKDSLGHFDVPSELRGAWDKVVGRLRGALDFVTAEDLRKLSTRVEELGAKVDRLIAAGKARSRRPTTGAPRK